LQTLVNLTQAMAGFGRWCPLVWEYTGAFATKRLGAIAPAKRLRIVTELAKLWETGIFSLERKQYRITKDKIIESMRKVCDLEKHGFGNHNYLKRVMSGDAERISAEGLSASEEARREEDKKVRREEDKKEEGRMSPEAQAAFKKQLGVSSFKELIGKRARGQRTEDGGQKNETAN